MKVVIILRRKRLRQCDRNSGGVQDVVDARYESHDRHLASTGSQYVVKSFRQVSQSVCHPKWWTYAMRNRWRICPLL